MIGIKNQNAAASTAHRMKGIYEVRRENLLRLISERFEASQTKLADALCVRPNYISRLCNAHKNIGDELARKLEYIAELSAHWLDQDHAEQALASAASRHRVPLVSWASVAKSRLKETPHVEDGAMLLPSPIACSERTVILKVQGVSMLPRFHEGDLIFVDPEADPAAHSGFCIAMHAGAVEPICRQLFEEGGRMYLRALNPSFPEPITRVADDTQIIGAVICKLELI
jgi:SOS-response transcriptional repressor LexA